MRHVYPIGKSVAALWMLVAIVAGCRKEPQETSFPLEEVSAFDAPEAFRRFFT